MESCALWGMMMTIRLIDLPSIEYLHECLLVNDDGRLIWKDRPYNHFKLSYTYKAWNKKYSGKCADVDMGTGYYGVCINGIRYKSHRIVYFMSVGKLDNESILDHINGNRKDNNPSNLSISTHSQNTVNFKGCRSDNINKSRGVSWKEKNKKWEASAFKDGKRFYLGLFVDKDEAITIASQKRKELFGEFWESQNGN